MEDLGRVIALLEEELLSLPAARSRSSILVKLIDSCLEAALDSQPPPEDKKRYINRALFVDERHLGFCPDGHPDRKESLLRLRKIHGRRGEAGDEAKAEFFHEQARALGH